MNPHIIEAVRRSMTELRAQGRGTVRIRMHPDDLGLKLFGVPVVFDEDTRRGEPVAEWDPSERDPSERDPSEMPDG